jgi:hypothetical protein
MHQPLFEYLATQLSAPRPLAGQTERQLGERHELSQIPIDSLFANPDAHLEDFEVETIFGPLVAVSLNDRAAVSPLLRDCTLGPPERNELLEALVQARLARPVIFPDGTVRLLGLGEPLLDRYLRLLRVDTVLLPEVLSQLYAALPRELAQTAHALARERSLARSAYQQVFARLLAWAAGRRQVALDDLIAAADFVAAQSDLSPAALVRELEQLTSLAKEALDKAKAGRTYMSQAVAEHHDSHGMGELDEALISQREVTWLRLSRLLDDVGSWAAST